MNFGRFHGWQPLRPVLRKKPKRCRPLNFSNFFWLDIEKHIRILNIYNFWDVIFPYFEKKSRNCIFQLLHYLFFPGGRFSSQILLCSQILLSIFCGKFFSNDGKFFFQFENQETLFSSFKIIIFIFFFQSSFNLRSTKLYFLLSVFF